MGEIADGLINGDFDEETGEYIGEGYGYPRSLQREARERKQNREKAAPSLTVESVKKKLTDNGYEIKEERQIHCGLQLRLTSSGIVNIFSSKKIVVQGQPDEKLSNLF